MYVVILFCCIDYLIKTCLITSFQFSFHPGTINYAVFTGMFLMQGNITVNNNNKTPAEKNNRHLTKLVMVLLVIMGLVLVLLEIV